MSSVYEAIEIMKKHASEDNPGVKEELPKAAELLKKLIQKKANGALEEVEENAVIFLTALLQSDKPK